MQHYNGVRICFRHRLDQAILAFRHPHVRPVVAFALIGVRQTGKHHSHLRLLCRGHGFGNLFRRCVVLLHGVALHIGYVQAVFLRGFHGAGRFKAVDVAAPAALEARFFRKLADEGNRVVLLQGQDVPVVLQQHHAFGGHVCGHPVLGFLVPGSFRLRVLHIAVDDVQDPLAAEVHLLLIQFSGFDRFHDLPVVDPAGCGHLQVQPRRHAGNAVAHGAPVRHDITLEAPFLPEYIRQQPGILGGVHAVDPVVGAHDRPGLGFLHGHLKGREVDLTDRPLVRVGGTAHPPVLLVIEGEMLDTGAHVFALDTLDQRGRHHARQVRILGEILEVPSAQRAALDVHGRAQQHAQLFMLAGFAQGFTHLFDQFGIKGSRRRAGRGEAYRLDAFVDSQVVRLVVLLPQAVRAVADHAPRNAEAFHGLGMPEVLAGQEPGLFLQRHFGNQVPDVLNIHMSPQNYCYAFCSRSTVLRSHGSWIFGTSEIRRFV